MSKQESSRKVPMEVLSFGMSRTGTASIHAAFQILGIPNPYHSFRFIDHPPDGSWWERAADAKFKGKGKPFTKDDWDRHLSDFGAVTDIGGYMFWRELAEAYPKAKIILVERDIEKWYHSFTTAVLPGCYNPTVDFIVKYIEPTIGPRTANASRKLYEGYFEAPPGGVEEIKKNAKRIYRKHYEEIRAEIPKERLLDYQLGSGWEPLCKFLGKAIPDEPFPHVNESAVLQEKIAAATRQTLKDSAAFVVKRAVLPIALASAALYFQMWRT